MGVIIYTTHLLLILTLKCSVYVRDREVVKIKMHPLKMSHFSLKKEINSHFLSSADLMSVLPYKNGGLCLLPGLLGRPVFN